MEPKRSTRACRPRSLRPRRRAGSDTEAGRGAAHHQGMRADRSTQRHPGRRPPGDVARSASASVLGLALMLLVAAGGGLGAAAGTPDAPGPVLEAEVRYHAQDQVNAWTGRAPLHFEHFEIDPDDLSTARLEALVRVAELRSGNAFRDFTARTTVFAAADHPEVRFALRRVTGASRLPPAGSVELLLGGDLTLRGEVREIRVPAQVEVDGATAHASVRFEIALEAYGLPAPRFLMLVVDDRVTVEADVWWRLDRDSTTTTR
jgi:polyisoprenoid-binding protein YceI